ncbi:MAG: hypothetical protein MMC33_004190 [Icmadophila ericetorum]|nr:hypothetical protein [Icmadophila ericetorum]
MASLMSTVQEQDSSSPSSPLTRAYSPSPSISPTPALSACPSLDRCFSGTSTISTFSIGSRSSSGSTSQRRGYVRPQGVSFAESARNRDSVMSLGSIAHLQYYFARTGILDGKGGQLAKERKPSYNLGQSVSADTSLGIRYVLPEYQTADYAISSIDEDEISQDWDDPVMLPPTVSTYSHRMQYIPPPPDAATMKEDLTKSLADVKQALREAEDQVEAASDETSSPPSQTDEPNEDSTSSESSSNGWHEIQGLHMLDVLTSAIRAAKIYYTSHEHPQHLATIKPERQIREELLGVMDILKRMAARHFAGGIKTEERRVFEDWMKGVEDLLVKEEAIEEQEAQDRVKWRWLEGDWSENDRVRERLFLNAFIENEELPAWTPPSNGEPLPTPFLEKLRNGLTLDRLHNAVLKKTKRRFPEIKNFHTDTAKPYRAAENLRFWIKAAEIRWEIKLQVDVMAVVQGSSDAAWKGFDAAILSWCQAVREEITKEWKQGSVQVPVLTAETTTVERI